VYFLNCDNTELKTSSKINFSVPERYLGGSGFNIILSIFPFFNAVLSILKHFLSRQISTHISPAFHKKRQEKNETWGFAPIPRAPIDSAELQPKVESARGKTQRSDVEIDCLSKWWSFQGPLSMKGRNGTIGCPKQKNRYSAQQMILALLNLGSTWKLCPLRTMRSPIRWEERHTRRRHKTKEIDIHSKTMEESDGFFESAAN